jgi:xanthine/CO dehydrogenase XdhC/CoxF family maturation factor
MNRDDDDLLAALGQWQSGGKPAALATVVSTWGSSPRPEGSHLAIDGQGHFLGSVSGGCIEGAVIESAREVMAGAAPRLLEFGVSDEQAWEVGLACGGRVQVYVESGALVELAARIAAAGRQRRPLVVVTRLADAARCLVSAEGIEGGLIFAAAAALAEARERLASGRSGRWNPNPNFSRAPMCRRRAC